MIDGRDVPSRDPLPTSNALVSFAAMNGDPTRGRGMNCDSTRPRARPRLRVGLPLLEDSLSIREGTCRVDSHLPTSALLLISVRRQGRPTQPT